MLPTSGGDGPELLPSLAEVVTENVVKDDAIDVSPDSLGHRARFGE